MNKEIFVARLKDARERKNLTLKELSEKCGISLSAMNRYVGMSSVPTLEVASAIAQTLDVSLDWLCGLQDDESNSSTVTTGKLIRILSQLLTTTTIINRNGEQQKVAQFEQWNNGNVFIEIDQSSIPSIMDFNSWRSFMELYRDGTIDDDMYTAWIDKKAKELDSVVLPVHTGFTAVETDELPF